MANYGHTTGALSYGYGESTPATFSGEELEALAAETLDSVARLLEPVSPWGVALAARLEADAGRLRAAGATEAAPW